MTIADRIVDNLLAEVRFYHTEHTQQIVGDIAQSLMGLYPTLGPIKVIVHPEQGEASLKFTDLGVTLHAFECGRYSGWTEGESYAGEGFVMVGLNRPSYGSYGTSPIFELENREHSLGGSGDLFRFLRPYILQARLRDADSSAKDFMDRS